MTRVTLPLNELPPINLSNIDMPHYRMHFRVISEDRNRSSHWSRLFLLEPAAIPIVSAGSNTKPITLTVTNTADSVQAVWNESVFLPATVTQPKTGQLKLGCAGHELEVDQRVAISCAGSEIKSDSLLLGHLVVESITDYFTVQTPDFRLGDQLAADFTATYRLAYRSLDLYYKWSNSNWIYAGESTPNDSISIRRVSGATTIDFAWQRLTNPNVRYDDGVNTDSPVTAYVYQHTLT